MNVFFSLTICELEILDKDVYFSPNLHLNEE